MFPWPKTNSQWLALVLGLFELIIAAPNHLTGDHMMESHNHENIASEFFFLNPQGRYMWAAFVTLLGLQRLSYAFTPVPENSKQFHWPWLVLVMTHLLETCLWYALAMNQPYWSTLNSSVLRTGLNPKNMFLYSVTFSGSMPYAVSNFVLLVGVPLITASFAIWGP